jgi:hypothetical protein
VSARHLGQQAIRAVVDRDFDLFALLAAATLLLAVELFNGHWTTALFAGTLGALALSLLRVRHDISTINAGPTGLSSIFLPETPADVLLSYESASELYLVGVSLDRTLRDAYTAIEDFLRRGGSLRVLLVDPNADLAIRVADRRAYHEQGFAHRKGHIEGSIATFADLAARTGGEVQLKVIADPLTFGATMIDGDRGSTETRIVIQHYSFKKREAREPNPVFVVRPTDGVWFGEFREELENLWNAGRDWVADEQ